MLMMLMCERRNVRMESGARKRRRKRKHVRAGNIKPLICLLEGLDSVVSYLSHQGSGQAHVYVPEKTLNSLMMQESDGLLLLFVVVTDDFEK